MRVVHLSTSDIGGGASRAAYRLHKGLCQIGVDSVMFVKEKYSDNPSVIKLTKESGFKTYISKFRKKIIQNDFNRYIRTRPKDEEAFSDDRSFLAIENQLPESDIYHLHWTSNFIDLQWFFTNIHKPVVWTLHDMFAFTGGCHYNNGCQKFKSECGACPQLGSTKAADLSKEIWQRKFKSINDFNEDIYIRADSFWLASEAASSSIMRKLDIGTIHYGIETEEFIPRDKTACRAALNIPSESKIVVFGAPDINNVRKGFRQLKDAMHKVREVYPSIFLLSFGAGSFTHEEGIKGLHLGKISNNHLLSLVYNCGDVFIIPSLQEAFGQTALEAMSCGIPVAGFNTGGIPDMVKNDITGYLADTGNSESLSQAILKILKSSSESYFRLSNNCREVAKSKFSLTIQADNYLKLYNSILPTD